MKTKTRKRVSPSIAPAEQAGPIIRRHDTWSIGDCAHQGDLTLVCIGKLVPGSAKPRKDRQLAPGSTVGSRHVVEGGEVFDCSPAAIVRLIQDATNRRVDPAPQYIGPVFAGPCVIRHPQHQDQAFPADTMTAVVFQRNQDAEEREHRAVD